MTDSKGEKPNSDLPDEHDLPLELHEVQEGTHAPGEEHPLEAHQMSASTDEFHFSGPVEELDFTEPADFTFPTEQTSGAEVTSEQTDFAAAEPFDGEMLFGGAESTSSESSTAEAATTESEVVGEAIGDVEVAEEEEGAKPKRKFELPPWARTAEWVAIGVVGVGAFLTLIISVFWSSDPETVTRILNIACPVMLVLVAYAMWRSRPRWVTPAASAIYTVMLALSTAALITGIWFQGIELSRYDWQFSKARVAAGKPKPVFIAAPPAPVEKPEPTPAPAPAPAPNPAGPAAK